MNGYTKQTLSAAPTKSLVGALVRRHSADLWIALPAAVVALSVFVRLG